MVSVSQMARLVDCGFLTEEQYQKRVMGKRVTVPELLDWLSKYDIFTLHFTGKEWDAIAGAEIIEGEKDPVEALVKAVEAVQKEKANPVNFPKYVTILGTSAVILVEKKEKTAKYFRDAGVWNVWITWEDGKLMCRNNKGMMTHVNGNEARECTEEFWRKDNAGYV